MKRIGLTVIALCATLLCAGAARADLQWNDNQSFPATGQTKVYAAGDDGTYKAGASLSYKNNGDGTITDQNTGLMWEVKSNGDSSLHDVNNWYPWAGTCQDGSTLCGTTVDCYHVNGAPLCSADDGQGTGYTIFQWVAQINKQKFAHYNDWRIPNVKELQSIMNYGTALPSVSSAFNSKCVPVCTVTKCSCTESDGYWSSTTYSLDPTAAWLDGFDIGLVDTGDKAGEGFYVRAVRGGSH